MKRYNLTLTTKSSTKTIVTDDINYAVRVACKTYDFVRLNGFTRHGDIVDATDMVNRVLNK